MKRRMVLTVISPNLYKLLKKEKETLTKREQKKNNSRRKRITLYNASELIYRRATR